MVVTRINDYDRSHTGAGGSDSGGWWWRVIVDGCGGGEDVGATTLCSLHRLHSFPTNTVLTRFRCSLIFHSFDNVRNSHSPWEVTGV